MVDVVDAPEEVREVEPAEEVGRLPVARSRQAVTTVRASSYSRAVDLVRAVAEPDPRERGREVGDRVAGAECEVTRTRRRVRRARTASVSAASTAA